jgi:AcrR family transcriptional regulator
MPKVSALYRDTRRNEILEAALACFARNGFHETTIQDISHEAGLSHGAIYRYFPSKEDMVEAASRRDRGVRAGRFEEAEAGRRPLDAIDRLLASYVEGDATLESSSAQLRVVVFGEGVRNSKVNDSIRATWREVLGLIGAMVRRGQVAGEIDAELDPDAIALVVAALRDGLLIHQAIDPTVDAEACSQVVSALLHGRFATPTGAREANNGR